MPVKNSYDEIIAVAQLVNKNADFNYVCFSIKDEKVSKPLSVVSCTLMGVSLLCVFDVGNQLR